MKKLLSVTLAVCILLTVITALPFTAFAQETDLAVSVEKEGDFWYEVEDGEAIIAAYYGSAAELEIPSILGGFPVTRIGARVFQNHTELKSVVIPDSVTKIGEGAFEYCTNLTSVVIPNSVTSIGYYAFENCTGLISIVIPDSVTDIGWYAFCDCRGLTSVVIGNSVTDIGMYAFYGCWSLTSVVIGNSVKYIESHAFCGCSGLTSVVIPDSVTYIGEIAFAGCSGLTNVIIGNSVSRIGCGAFEDCTELLSVFIPDSVRWIDTHAFGYYYDISIGEGWYRKVDGFTIYGHRGTEAERYAKDNGFFFIVYLAPDFGYTVNNDEVTVTGITGSATELEIPSAIDGYPVTRIGDGAFEGCTELESVVIPDSVTDIGEQAFFGCTALKSLTVPASVTSIGNYALGYYPEGDNKSKIDGFTIYGHKGTAAEKYANDNGFTFIESEPSYIIGDADSDGVISVIDATQIQKKLAQLPVLPTFNEHAARVDGTETLHILDATYIQKWLAKIEVPYPIGQPAA